jgi:aryl-alcohol dehydrogenase-like predicted oxidoreductase
VAEITGHQVHYWMTPPEQGKDLDLRRAVHRGLRRARNFFDHANIYGRGRAEESFGRVLKERPSLRDKIVIQSKCGIRWADDPPGTFVIVTALGIEIDAVLQRLGNVSRIERPDDPYV